MRIPRDLSGTEITRALRVLGYGKVRQDGSHIRLTTTINGLHHLTVPNHAPLKPKNGNGIAQPQVNRRFFGVYLWADYPGLAAQESFGISGQLAQPFSTQPPTENIRQ